MVGSPWIRVYPAGGKKKSAGVKKDRAVCQYCFREIRLDAQGRYVTHRKGTSIHRRSREVCPASGTLPENR